MCICGAAVIPAQRRAQLNGRCWALLLMSPCQPPCTVMCCVVSCCHELSVALCMPGCRAWFPKLRRQSRFQALWSDQPGTGRLLKLMASPRNRHFSASLHGACACGYFPRVAPPCVASGVGAHGKQQRWLREVARETMHIQFQPNKAAEDVAGNSCVTSAAQVLLLS